MVKNKFLQYFAFVLLDFLLMGLQSLVHPLPSVDIVERTTGYTWALQGLCQQSKVRDKHIKCQ